VAARLTRFDEERFFPFIVTGASYDSMAKDGTETEQQIVCSWLYFED
jgi:hypothetical protein